MKQSSTRLFFPFIKPDGSVADRYKLCSQIFGVITLCSGIVALFGWVLNIPILKEAVSTPEMIGASSAIGFILSGLSVILLAIAEHHGTEVNFALVFEKIFASLVILIALLALGQSNFGWNLSATKIILHGAAREISAPSPWSTSDDVSASFGLLGLSLLLSGANNRIANRAAQIPGILLFLISLFALNCRLYDVRSIYNIVPFSFLPLQTIILFLLMAIAIPFAVPQWAFGGTLSSDTIGGVMLRRLLPYMVLVPIVLGWLRLEGQRLGLFSLEVGLSVHVLSVIATLIIVIWWNAWSLNMVDLRRSDAEKGLHNVELKYRTTLDNMMEGCQIIGFDWRYLYINGAAAKHGRRGSEEFIGKSMMELYPGIETTEMFSTLSRCMKDRLPQKLENEFLYADGSKGWFHLSMEPVPEGVFILSEEITKEKELDEELRKYHEHLEDLVKERTAQLEAANKELEAFSYSVSHDLRSPLRHIDGFADLLSRHAQASLDENDRRYVKLISDSAKEMGVLIDDLLVFSRMSRAEIRKTVVDVKPMVNNIINALRSEWDGRTIEWEVSALPEVEADPSMLHQVLQNLLENAVKYTRPRERALIQIGSVRENGDHIIFVRDNGVGFDMQYADKLFGVFQRLHSSSEFEGTGIGLANVRRIIQRHGGNTWAEGEVGKGASFFFSLPGKEEHENANRMM